MEIVPFDPKYLPQMTLLYEKVYSSPGDTYNVERARDYLQYEFENFPQYCWIAIENKKCLGGIFCKTIRHYWGQLLSIDSIQVEPDFQRKGIGSKLLNRVINEAKKNKLNGTWFVIDRTNKSLVAWYKKMGYPMSHYSLCYKVWDK